MTTPAEEARRLAEAMLNLRQRINLANDLHAVFTIKDSEEFAQACEALEALRAVPQEQNSAGQAAGAAVADEPYFLQVDVNGCDKCSAGRMWTVVGPSGAMFGQSWGDEEFVGDLVEWLNDAYANGRAASPAPESAPAGWQPTHRHAEGGMYQLLGEIKVHVHHAVTGNYAWLRGFLYRNEEGMQFARVGHDFEDRFTPLPAAPAQADNHEGERG